MRQKQYTAQSQHRIRYLKGGMFIPKRAGAALGSVDRSTNRINHYEEGTDYTTYYSLGFIAGATRLCYAAGNPSCDPCNHESHLEVYGGECARAARRSGVMVKCRGKGLYQLLPPYEQPQALMAMAP